VLVAVWIQQHHNTDGEKMTCYQAKTRVSQSGRVAFLPGTRAALQFTIGQRSFIHTVGNAVVSECWRVLAGTPNKGLHGGLPAIFENLPQHARGRGMYRHATTVSGQVDPPAPVPIHRQGHVVGVNDLWSGSPLRLIGDSEPTLRRCLVRLKPKASKGSPS
jgi:hypothetical protein